MTSAILITCLLGQVPPGTAYYGYGFSPAYQPIPGTNVIVLPRYFYRPPYLDQYLRLGQQNAAYLQARREAVMRGLMRRNGLSDAAPRGSGMSVADHIGRTYQRIDQGYSIGRGLKRIFGASKSPSR